MQCLSVVNVTLKKFRVGQILKSLSPCCCKIADYVYSYFSTIYKTKPQGGSLLKLSFILPLRVQGYNTQLLIYIRVKKSNFD